MKPIPDYHQVRSAKHSGYMSTVFQVNVVTAPMKLESDAPTFVFQASRYFSSECGQLLQANVLQLQAPVAQQLQAPVAPPPLDVPPPLDFGFLVFVDFDYLS